MEMLLAQEEEESNIAYLFVVKECKHPNVCIIILLTSLQ